MSNDTMASASDLELFANWKGYPLPELNSEGRFDKDYLHREFVAFCAGRRRTAAPVAEGVALTPLPPIDEHWMTNDHTYTAEQVRQAQRDAVGADRRAREKEHLSEMAAWARENGLSIPPAWEATVINYGTNLDAMMRQFRELPEPIYSALGLPDIFTAEQMFEYASKHVAPYAERIRQLDRKLKAVRAVSDKHFDDILALRTELEEARTAGPAVPEGYALAPLEPTDEMQDAPEVEIGGCYSCSPTRPSWGECADIYRAMIAAAPKPQEDAE